MLQVAYCDSQIYAAELNKFKTSEFFKFIFNIVESGITSKIYSQRAELIINHMNPSIEKLEYGNSLVLCESTISHAINKLIIDVPSAIEIKKCSIDACDTQVVSTLKYITFQVNDGETIKELQTYINTRTETEYINCGDNCKGVKTITTDISKMHLFIDILYWEGKLFYYYYLLKY